MLRVNPSLNSQVFQLKQGVVVRWLPPGLANGALVQECLPPPASKLFLVDALKVAVSELLSNPALNDCRSVVRLKLKPSPNGNYA